MYAPEAGETSAECTCVKLPGEDFRIVIEQEEDDGEDGHDHDEGDDGEEGKGRRRLGEAGLNACLESPAPRGFSP